MIWLWLLIIGVGAISLSIGFIFLSVIMDTSISSLSKEEMIRLNELLERKTGTSSDIEFLREMKGRIPSTEGEINLSHFNPPVFWNDSDAAAREAINEVIAKIQARQLAIGDVDPKTKDKSTDR